MQSNFIAEQFCNAIRNICRGAHGAEGYAYVPCTGAAVLKCSPWVMGSINHPSVYPLTLPVCLNLQLFYPIKSKMPPQKAPKQKNNHSNAVSASYQNELQQ